MWTSSQNNRSVFRKPAPSTIIHCYKCTCGCRASLVTKTKHKVQFFLPHKHHDSKLSHRSAERRRSGVARCIESYR
jgi:hypothetical protein